MVDNSDLIKYACIILLTLQRVFVTMATVKQNLSSKEADIFADVSRGSNSFAIQLYKVLSEANPDSNLIASPLSLQVALALTYSGAEGITADEIASLLKIPSDKNRFFEGYNLLVSILEDPVLHIATRIFVEKTFGVKEEFNKNALTYFKADAEPVDFIKESSSARLLINDWVEKKTNHKIKDLITEDFITPDTVMLLINAIHFKADWKFPFRVQATSPEKFYINEKDTVDVDMMHMTEKLRYAEHPVLKAKILELPYQGHDFSMFIILPNEITGLAKMEETLSTLNLADELKNLDRCEVIVSLPKFELEKTLDLKDILETLGVKNIFRDANFSGISDKPLTVSEVVQKAFIKVDEKGTEAAAATAVNRRKRSIPPDFCADHPFLFILSHSTGSCLFIGHVVKPNLSLNDGGGNKVHDEF
ncbi:leukocyte elastase inhibitor-like isoform X3 [Lycorma delicatula]|uniref:leukocyte elastase inhibitor-like isoform X3 n=1 Tax=Lycorma delicatula TaxID=130591 RepID=UPI003F5198AF